ncbi:hypothetical protein HRbin36_00462 [bacterium HR36]|nr:hypothetical protein HRbin36_00462 [bacterium HR36]
MANGCTRLQRFAKWCRVFDASYWDDARAMGRGPSWMERIEETLPFLRLAFSAARPQSNVEE